MCDQKKSIKELPPNEQLSLVKQRLTNDSVEFFVNSVLDPSVFIPSDGYQKDWPVDSQRFHDLLNMVYYELTDGEFLKPSPREMLLSLIREECRQGERRLSENESPRSENNPLIQGVLYLMNKESALDLQTADLAQRLCDLQAKGKIAQKPLIPAFTNIFSRQLNRLAPAFKGMGIDVVVRHEEDGSHCSMERLPAFLSEPSAEDLALKIPDDSSAESSATPSDVTPYLGTPLSVADGSQGRIRVDSPRDISRKPTDETDKPANSTPDQCVKGGAK